MTVFTKVTGNAEPIAQLRLVSRVLGTFIGLAGGLVLLGWMQEYDFLTNVLPGMPAMMPWTAAAFLMAGAALTLDPSAARRRRASLVAVGVILMGLLTLIEHGSSIRSYRPTARPRDFTAAPGWGWRSRASSSS